MRTLFHSSFVIFLTFILGIQQTEVQASQPQTTEGGTAVSHQSIVEHLKATGRVSINQDARLNELLGQTPKTYYSNARRGDGSSKIVSKGYRVRAYSGNQQAKSRAAVYKIQAELLASMPELETYVLFKSPNWRLMVGNFRTTEEAQAVLRQLKQKFPEYGREMFVVPSEIEI